MIVGICGFKGSGKGVVSSVLEKNGYIRVSSASPLKDAVSILFDWPRHLLEGDTQESRRWREKKDDDWSYLAGQGIFSDCTVITPRIVLQKIGTDIVRNMIGDDFWIHLLSKRISTIHRQNREDPSYRGVVIDDARFLNELSICDFTIRVDRYSYTEEEIRCMHQSESEHLQHIPGVVLKNSSSLQNLIDQTVELL